MNNRLFSVIVASTFLSTPAVAAYVTSQPAQLKSWNNTQIQALWTVGDTISGTSGNYTPIGIPDGLGAYKLNATTVRLLMNHEVGPANGYAYTLANGTSTVGSRVSYFDIDVSSRKIIDSGLAYSKIIDRTGAVVTDAAQIRAPGVTSGGFSRFCSSSLFDASQFGANKGFASRLYFMGEETSGGTNYAIDTATRTAYALPALGRGGWENVTALDTGRTDKVALLLGDDRSSVSGGVGGSAALMWVGTKNAAGDFLDQNGLKDGKLYAWTANDTTIKNASSLNGNGSAADGKWVEVANRGTPNSPGYDAQGYATQAQLDTLVGATGAFRFARPEDVATNPKNGTEAAFVTTGTSAGGLGTANTQGAIYRFNFDFSDINTPKTKVTVLYDGNKDTNGNRIRSPDNVAWAEDGTLWVNEDGTYDFGTDPYNKSDGRIIRLELTNGVATAMLPTAEIVRQLYPSTVDALPSKGDWETSGIIDVSSLFGVAAGTLFLTSVQAHGLRDGLISSLNLVEGGQLVFINAVQVPEPATVGLLVAGLAGLGIARRRKRLA
jgi:hypothetical protein